MSVLFKRPAGSLAISIEDFVKVPLRSLSFLDQEIEVDQTIVTEIVIDGLDWDRLRDHNDDYESILFLPEREIVYKDGEYKLGIPMQTVTDEPIQDTEDSNQLLDWISLQIGRQYSLKFIDYL